MALLGLVLVAGCGLKAPLPDVAQMPANCRVVKLAPGPEDFVLDRWQAAPRLLVSSYDRRTAPPNGGIFAFDIKSGAVYELPRQGEAGRIQDFRPQGMDIRRDGDQTLLYVILHDPYGNGSRLSNGVGIYAVHPDRLDLLTLLADERFLWSPNDLSVLADGEIYLTNDYRSDLDIYFKRRVSEVVRYDPTQKSWTVVADRLCMANGILAQPRRVFVSTTLGNTLYLFDRAPDGSLGKGREVVHIKGLDNIMPDGERLLITAHFDDLAFVKHSKSAAHPSPAVIFRVDPAKGKATALYADSGAQFSAASTALIWNGKLYASQVFDAYLLVCDAP